MGPVYIETSLASDCRVRNLTRFSVHVDPVGLFFFARNDKNRPSTIVGHHMEPRYIRSEKWIFFSVLLFFSWTRNIRCRPSTMTDSFYGKGKSKFFTKICLWTQQQQQQQQLNNNLPTIPKNEKCFCLAWGGGFESCKKREKHLELDGI